MKNAIILAAVVLVVIIGAVLIFVRGGQGPAAISSPAVSPSPLSEITVQMTADNNSGETGTAILKAEGAQTKVIISAVGFTQGVSQASHIHAGSCGPVGGAVKYPLSAIVNGQAETTINVSLTDLLAQLPLYVNMHRSTTDFTQVSCGNITK